MKIDGFRCDTCRKEYFQSLRIGLLPPEWFSLIKDTGPIVQQEKHFCCIECLIKWTSLQTVDSRKFDVEGLVNSLTLQNEVKIVRAEVTPSNSEHWRRFDDASEGNK